MKAFGIRFEKMSKPFTSAELTEISILAQSNKTVGKKSLNNEYVFLFPSKKKAESFKDDLICDGPVCAVHRTIEKWDA